MFNFTPNTPVREQRTAATIKDIQARYSSNYDTWFDGTPESIDTRLAQCDQLLKRYTAAVSSSVGHPDANLKRMTEVLAGVEELREDKRNLEALRHDIMTAGMYREAAESKSKPVRYDSNIKYSRFVELESRAFLAENRECNDRQELLSRAKRHAEIKTSTLSPNASQIAVAAFVDRVAELARQAPRKKQAKRVSAFVPDFEDELLYLQ